MTWQDDAKEHYRSVVEAHLATAASERLAEALILQHPAEYHPFLFCELYKLGHHDPAAYLAQALPSALVLLPRRAGDNVAEHFQIVKRGEQP